MRKGALGPSDPRGHYALPDFFCQLVWCPHKVGLHMGRMGAGLVHTDQGGIVHGWEGGVDWCPQT